MSEGTAKMVYVEHTALQADTDVEPSYIQINPDGEELSGELSAIPISAFMAVAMAMKKDSESGKCYLKATIRDFSKMSESIDIEPKEFGGLVRVLFDNGVLKMTDTEDVYEVNTKILDKRSIE